MIETGFGSAREGSWQRQAEIVVANLTRVLLVRGSRLPVSPIAGYVVVFDDVTDLARAQRDAAWAEVARRLAHEIKNPLTPIQLAVQEIESKYRGDDPEYRRLLATAQEILKEEVGAIRRLVDDFSAFAKLPKVEPAPIDLAQAVEDFARAHPEWQPFLRIDRGGQVGALCDRMLLRTNWRFPSTTGPASRTDWMIFIRIW